MPISTARRTRRIDLRATPRQETLIQQAASQTDRSVSEFILSSATLEAERVLADRRWFSVTSEQFDAIEAVLDAPLEETSRFARLWNRPSPFGTRIDLDDESLAPELSSPRGASSARTSRPVSAAGPPSWMTGSSATHGRTRRPTTPSCTSPPKMTSFSVTTPSRRPHTPATMRPRDSTTAAALRRSRASSWPGSRWTSGLRGGVLAQHCSRTRSSGATGSAEKWAPPPSSCTAETSRRAPSTSPTATFFPHRPTPCTCCCP